MLQQQPLSPLGLVQQNPALFTVQGRR